MPVPPGTRYRFGKPTNGERKRYAFSGNKVVEVKTYHRKNGKWVKGHLRRHAR